MTLIVADRIRLALGDNQTGAGGIGGGLPLPSQRPPRKGLGAPALRTAAVTERFAQHTMIAKPSIVR
jgi:hypothetical protein